jgi:beta-glucosidase
MFCIEVTEPISIRIEEAMKHGGSCLAVVTLMCCSWTIRAQQKPGYLDPSLPPAQRAADLVRRMTLEEKVLQMQSTAPAIPRLSVPAYVWWNEALHGVVRGRATVFPQAIALGATWDSSLLSRISDAISTEARAKYNEAHRHPMPVETGILPGRTAGLTYWSPNINIFRDPRWGRGQETYGEDPFLTGRMGVAFVGGMQGRDPRYLKTVATPKHYAVHSGPESLRHVFDARISEHDLVDTYLPAFRAAVTLGKAASVMCVYNSVDGVPGCANTDLLQKRLRQQWRFKGYVVSDCGAVADIFNSHKYSATLGGAAVAAVEAGTDLTCGEEYKSLVDEVKSGRIAEAEIDRSVERLFEARIRLGMFDPPALVPFSKIPITENDSKDHRRLALVAARESIVLLKNQNGILPLKASLRKIAVIGPSADDPIAPRGNLNYAGIPSHLVTPLEGIKRQFPAAKVAYALGATYTPSIPSLVPATVLTTPDGKNEGLEAEYFANVDFLGEPRLRRVEPRINFERDAEDPAIVSAVGDGNYSIRWTGTLTVPASGEYGFIARTGIWNRDGKARLFIDDKELVPPARTPFHSQAAAASGTGTATQPPMEAGAVPPPGWWNPLVKTQLEAGHRYAFRVEYTQKGPGGSAEFSWIPPLESSLAEAVKAARDSDVALVFVGLNSQLEGENTDRKSIELPETQEKLVEAVIATGKPTIVVLTAGSAISAGYAADHADALIDAWYGGEEAGTAIAEVLAGVINPSGRLPVTFYAGADQLPSFEDYSMKNRTYRYFRGTPLYPFGYGLSYTTFSYSNLSLPSSPIAAGQPLAAEVKVMNMGKVAGDEVVQLYLSFPSVAGAPIRALRGFQRVHLDPRQSQKVRFDLEPRDLSMVTDDGTIVIPEGNYSVSVGGGQPSTGAATIVGTFEINGSFVLPE